MTFGTPLGIQIRLGTGWLVLFVLITASLVLWVGVPEAPGAGPIARLAAALAVPLVLLPLVVGHELAHAVAARRAGLPALVVDLALVGAATVRMSDATRPRSAAAIAIAGPLFSGIVGLGMVGLALLFDRMATDLTLLVAWVCWCLGAANLVLAVVSLYPGVPMDGGQLVHAVAWGFTGDQLRASRIAAVIGRTSGWVVMVAGLIVALTVDLTAGLWLALMGWFLGRAGRMAVGQERLMRLTTGLDVADAIQREVPVVTPTLTLDTLIDQQRLSGGSTVYPVVRGDTLVGVLNLRDVRRIPARARKELRVEDRMRPLASLTSVTEHQDLWDAVAILERGRLDALPVVATDDPARFLGLVTRSSVIRLLRSRAGGAPGQSRVG